MLDRYTVKNQFSGFVLRNFNWLKGSSFCLSDLFEFQGQFECSSREAYTGKITLYSKKFPG